jgi:hypothetical protein
MTTNEFLTRLQTATAASEVDEAIAKFEAANGASLAWVPLGGRQNNRGNVEISTDPGRALVERITNGIDALLEAEHAHHNGLPQCRTPREAAAAWLNVPGTGLSGMTPADRRRLAQSVTIRLLPGDTKSARILEVRDFGIGLSADLMPHTILSLNESNKMQKHYLAGAYGQGGSSTFASSSASLIASRRLPDDPVAFTVVRFEDLPPDEYKTGHYVYLTMHGDVLEADIAGDEFPNGTLVRHFGYDLSDYGSPLGVNSVYGLLNKALFDPVMPVWFDNRLHDYRRVIKGSRNALNGAVDEGDDSRGPRLSHSMPILYLPLGESGRIGIEYWVLEAPEKANKKPTAAFVNPAKPIVLTLNGQTHEELGQILVRKNAELPYLTQRIICHIECNSLTTTALRGLFVSNREGARKGHLLERIKDELVSVLKSDDELARLNVEAKQQSLKSRDETAVLEARKAVARLLRAQGFSLPERVGGVTTREPNEPPGTPTPPHPPTPPPKPIELRDPPTYIRIVWPDDKDISFHAEQRRYIRIETDAESAYFDPKNAHASRVNFIVSDGEVVFRTGTPLQGGRMRGVFDCPTGARIGGKGTITVELHRAGLPTVSDSREFRIVEKPKAKDDDRKTNLPPFDLQPISQEESMWETLGWPDDPAQIASQAVTEEGVHVVYYSTDFPNFKERYKVFERSDPATAASFQQRYGIWLAVHSLLHQDQMRTNPPTEEDEERAQAYERAERVRVASMAAMVAAQEVRASDAEVLEPA